MKKEAPLQGVQQVPESTPGAQEAALGERSKAPGTSLHCACCFARAFLTQTAPYPLHCAVQDRGRTPASGQWVVSPWECLTCSRDKG